MGLFYLCQTLEYKNIEFFKDLLSLLYQDDLVNDVTLFKLEITIPAIINYFVTYSENKITLWVLLILYFFCKYFYGPLSKFLTEFENH